jgi:sugar lactone lactonase YvrE
LPKSFFGGLSVRLPRTTVLVLLLFADSIICFAQSQSSIITTYVGPGKPANGLLATAQAIGAPSSMVADGMGGFYVSIGSQNVVYQVTSDGRISVAAGDGTPGFAGDGGPAASARLSYPTGLALDSAGNLFLADSGNNRIRKVTTLGIISTVAGTGTANYYGDNDRAILAELNNPRGIVLDASGNLLIADSANNRVRKVTTLGIISTIAGTGSAGFGGDVDENDDDEEDATSAILNYPTSLAVDAAGSIFVADCANQRIRKITTDGDIDTVVGNGAQGFSGDGGQATSAELNNPVALALDDAGNLYIADSYNFRIRKVSGGTITTIAGTGEAGFSGDGGQAISAQLYVPSGLMVDRAGNLFIADYVNRRIRKVSTTGVITTVAGTGMEGFSGDGSQATQALLHLPTAVAVDSTGNLFIADSSNSRIRKVTAGGVISTVAGGGSQGFAGDGGQATSAGLNGPVGVAVDPSGKLFITDFLDQRVRKVTPNGVITTIAGNGTQGYSGDGGPATSAQLNQPWGIAVDGSGSVFIADLVNHCIRKVAPSGVISTVAGDGKPGFSGDGEQSTSAQLKFPAGVAVDNAGNLYIADSGNNRVRKVDSAGIIRTVAGTDIAGYSGDGIQAVLAQLNGPTGVAVDAVGNLFVVDHHNSRIRVVTSEGVISTVAGIGTAGFSGDGGSAISAQLNGPMAVALGKAGILYVADYANSRIRKVAPATSTTSYFPQVAVGNGYSTLFVITNSGSMKASGTLKLMDPEGNPFSITGTLSTSTGAIRSTLSGSVFPLSVSAGETIFLAASAIGPDTQVKVGWGQLESTAGLLAGTASYEYFDGSTLKAVIDTLQSPLLQSATIAVDYESSQDKQVAYAIANPSGRSIAIKLSLAEGDGRISGDTVHLTLGPKQHIANYLWRHLAPIDFKGSLVLEGQGGANFIAVAFLDNQSILTPIPLTPVE